MEQVEPGRYTVFAGSRRLGRGDLGQAARAAKEAVDSGENSPVLIFEDATSQIIDVDLRGSLDDVLARVPSGHHEDGAPAAPRGRGRPKLGVVAREVTLLPRHWDWLNMQPGGASVALRRLVDDARKLHAGRDRLRQAQEAAYRFMSAMAGNYPGFEEATRALFAGSASRFDAHTAQWPADVRDHARLLAGPALNGEQPGMGARDAGTAPPRRLGG